MKGCVGEAHSGEGIFAFKLGNVLSLGVPNSAPDTASDTKQVLKEYLWPHTSDIPCDLFPFWASVSS